MYGKLKVPQFKKLNECKKKKCNNTGNYLKS